MKTVKMEVEEEMDKRSFIRGFGMGVLFAAVILGISCLMRTSDSAVIKRAKQLGMTYAAQEEKLFQTSAPKNSAAAKTPEPSFFDIPSLFHHGSLLSQSLHDEPDP